MNFSISLTTKIISMQVMPYKLQCTSMQNSHFQAILNVYNELNVFHPEVFSKVK
jgi:hypothetical protein